MANVKNLFKGRHHQLSPNVVSVSFSEESVGDEATSKFKLTKVVDYQCHEEVVAKREGYEGILIKGPLLCQMGPLIVVILQSWVWRQRCSRKGVLVGQK